MYSYYYYALINIVSYNDNDNVFKYRSLLLKNNVVLRGGLLGLHSRD
jgi:hypothetical protein